MRRCSAYVGLLAMLVALLTAPLFHVHEHDDHGHEMSVVHAHLGDGAVPEHHSSNGIEEEQTHAQARSVDIYVFDALSFGVVWPVELAVALPIPILEQRGTVRTATLPRAHGPPGGRSSPPRSPPVS